jgi:TolB-like protein
MNFGKYNTFRRGFPIVRIFLTVFGIVFLLLGCGQKTTPVQESLPEQPAPAVTREMIPEKHIADPVTPERVYRDEYIGSSIAVLYFENNTPVKARDYDFLSKWLSTRLTDSLGQNATIRMVERNAIDNVLEELDIGTSGLIDKQTSLKLGKLIAADYFVFGNYFAIQKSLYCTARLVDAATGIVVKAEEVMGSTSDLTEIANRINDSLLIGMGRKIQDSEYRKTGSQENLDVALLYVRGMEFLDNGNKEQAIESFMYILKLDKTNWWAKKKIKEILGPGAQ